MFTFTKVFFLGLPNLGAQIRCIQNPKSVYRRPKGPKIPPADDTPFKLC